MLSSTTIKAKNIILLGDMNINILSNNNFTYLNTLSNFNLVQINTTPTRITQNTVSLIDHIFVSENLSHSCYPLYPDFQLTDHVATSFYIETPESHKNCQTNYQRKHTRNNIDCFIHTIKNTNWDMTSSNAETLFEVFNQKLIKIYDESFPLVAIKTSNKKRKPWITDKIIKIINHKDFLYRSWKKSKKLCDQQKFLKAQKSCITDINAAKKSYYHMILTPTANSRNSWHTINKLLGKSQKKVIHIADSNDNPLPACDIPNAFKKHYSLPSSQTTKTLQFHNNNKNNETSFYLSPTTGDEVHSCIISLKNGCANQATCIPIKILKLVAHLLCYQLSEIINCSFETGVFSTSLKKGEIRPIFKKNDRSKIINYRPVCILPIFSKIYEKAKRLHLKMQQPALFTIRIYQRQELSKSHHAFTPIYDGKYKHKLSIWIYSSS